MHAIPATPSNAVQALCAVSMQSTASSSGRETGAAEVHAASGHSGTSHAPCCRGGSVGCHDTMPHSLPLGQTVASGGQAQIVRSTLRDGRTVALKVFHGSKLDALHREVRAFRRLGGGCEHIVRVLGMHPSGSPGQGSGGGVATWSVAMEVADEDLHTAMERIQGGGGLGDTPFARATLLGVAKALVHCHALGVAHRDVKPSNILVFHEGGARGTPVAKLCDFGVSSATQNIPKPPGRVPYMLSTRATGTLCFSPPEVLVQARLNAEAFARGETCQYGYNVFTVDVWCLGVTLFCVCSNRMPFHHASMGDKMYRSFLRCTQDVPALHESPATGELPLWRWPKHFSAQLVSLVTACLRHDAETRPTMQWVAQHPWFTSTDAPSQPPCWMVQSPRSAPVKAVPVGGGGGCIRVPPLRDALPGAHSTADAAQGTSPHDSKPDAGACGSRV